MEKRANTIILQKNIITKKARRMLYGEADKLITVRVKDNEHDELEEWESWEAYCKHLITLINDWDENYQIEVVKCD